MKKFTCDEMSFLNSLNSTLDKVDNNLINSLVNKMLQNKDYEELITLLNSLYDFSEVSLAIADRLIIDNNKECISVFLEKEDILYFLTDEEKSKLKAFLNVSEVNIKLVESYEYYYNLLFKQGVRLFKSVKVNDSITEYIFMKNNKLINFKIKEIKEFGLVVSYVNYSNYYLSDEEQIIKGIDYINEYGFNIDKSVNSCSTINI